MHPRGQPHQRLPSLVEEPDLSVIVPFYNEEDNVEPMHAAIVDAVERLAIPFEMVFVDDGSQDRTLQQAIGLARNDVRVRVVQFRRNFGQTAAMAAGIELARGKVLITMDGDLQNDPGDIALLLAKLNEGYDFVAGWRHDRHDELVSRRLPSHVANWLIGRITGVPIRDTACTLKAYRAALIKEIPLYSDMHRFIPAIASIAGLRIAEIKVRHHPRRFGESKYGLSRVYKVCLDLMMIKTVTSFTARPLLWFSLLATPLLLLGLLAIGFSLLRWAGDAGVLPLPAAGTGVILLIAAFILICGGVLGELVYKLGDNRDQRFSRLTRTVWGATSVMPEGRNAARG